MYYCLKDNDDDVVVDVDESNKVGDVKGENGCIKSQLGLFSSGLICNAQALRL